MKHQTGLMTAKIVVVTDAATVETAADRIEKESNSHNIWIDIAFSTVFSPVAKLTPAEVLHSTQVIRLGQAYGRMAALKRKMPRNRGSTVDVGSALTYRSTPLQAMYCDRKAVIRGSA